MLRMGRKCFSLSYLHAAPLVGELGQALAIRDKPDAGFSLSDESLQRGLIHGN